MAKMKKMYIVKRGPDDKGCFSGNKVTGTNLETAIEKAQHYAENNRCRFVVFEAVAAFEPASNVREVEIEDEG